MLNMQNIYYPANLNADGVHLSPYQYTRHKKKHVNDHFLKHEKNNLTVLEDNCCMCNIALTTLFNIALF